MSSAVLFLHGFPELSLASRGYRDTVRFNRDASSPSSQSNQSHKPASSRIAGKISGTLKIATRKRVRSRGADYADQILALLEKHSDIRALRFRAFLAFSGLSALIKHAVKHNVQTLDIDVSTCDYFNGFTVAFRLNQGRFQICSRCCPKPHSLIIPVFRKFGLDPNP